MLSLTVPAVRTDKFEVNREAVVSPVRWPLKSLIIHYELLHRSPLLSTTYLLLIYDRSLYTFSYMKLFLTLHTSFSDPKRHILNTHTLVLLRDADWNVFNQCKEQGIHFIPSDSTAVFHELYRHREPMSATLSLFLAVPILALCRYTNIREQFSLEMRYMILQHLLCFERKSFFLHDLRYVTPKRNPVKASMRLCDVECLVCYFWTDIVCASWWAT